jgi:hypothetical protein
MEHSLENSKSGGIKALWAPFQTCAKKLQPRRRDCDAIFRKNNGLRAMNRLKHKGNA